MINFKDELVVIRGGKSDTEQLIERFNIVRPPVLVQAKIQSLWHLNLTS